MVWGHAMAGVRGGLSLSADDVLDTFGIESCPSLDMVDGKADAGGCSIRDQG